MGYSTNDELKYIAGLGGFRPRRSRSAGRRAALLKNYLRAAWSRTDWGRIDRRMVMNHVRQEIKVADLPAEASAQAGEAISEIAGFSPDPLLKRGRKQEY